MLIIKYKDVKFQFKSSHFLKVVFIVMIIYTIYRIFWKPIVLYFTNFNYIYYY
jgi:hypothetical protein